jgi:hypothetical protein
VGETISNDVTEIMFTENKVIFYSMLVGGALDTNECNHTAKTNNNCNHYI